MASHDTTVIHSAVQTGNELIRCRFVRSCSSQSGPVFRCSLVFGIRKCGPNHIRKRGKLEFINKYG
jgi:hypothetical protein